MEKASQKVVGRNRLESLNLFAEWNPILSGFGLSAIVCIKSPTVFLIVRSEIRQIIRVRPIGDHLSKSGDA